MGAIIQASLLYEMSKTLVLEAEAINSIEYVEVYICSLAVQERDIGVKYVLIQCGLYVH